MACDHDGQHRHHARLVALADDGQRVARRLRRLGAGQRQRLGDAQAAAIEQRQHGGVAGQHPGLALLAGAGRRSASPLWPRWRRAGGAGSCRGAGRASRQRPRPSARPAARRSGRRSAGRRAGASACGCRRRRARRSARKARRSSGFSAARSARVAGAPRWPARKR